MRGDDPKQAAMFSYLTLAQRIPADHPARQIRALVDRALERMDAELEKLYSDTGRPSIAPERLLRSTLLMILYSIRSERQLMEQMNYNLLFRWFPPQRRRPVAGGPEFVGLEMDDAVWDVTVFTKNRERLIAGAISQKLLESVMVEARAHELLSEEHFTVDGTLIQAWASARSFHEKSDPPGSGSGSKGALLLRDKVESTTDPEARLYKKSKADKSVPAYMGHALIENRNGLAVAAEATEAGNAAERASALAMLDRTVGPQQERDAALEITLGADTLYQEEKFIEALRQRAVAPHVSEYTQESSNLGKNSLSQAERADPRRAISQKKRKLIEKVFGWAKLDSMLRQVKMRGLKRVDWFYRLTMAAYNLMRLRKLIPIEALAC